MRLAQQIAEALPAALLETHTAADGGIRHLLRQLWTSADAIILVMAAGAATRLIAPLLSDKRTDPGVIVVDDAGRFAISLLGGHRADANALAGQVASITGGQAVTTTAAEALGLPSIESLARENGWVIENDGVAVTRLAAAIVNGEPIGVLASLTVRSWWPGPAEQILAFETIERLAEADLDVSLLITDQVIPRAYASNLDHWVIARPGTLVAGIGCSSGAPLAELESLLLSALDQAGLSQLSLTTIATIDSRADEPAIQQLAAKLDRPLRTFTSQALACVTVPNPSGVVQAAVGTPSVSEAAALLASGADRLLLTKRKNAVATVALARLA
jgi:cobalt-precorrin 5A hydrolase/precorrin-3B C17-methyltransferase